MKVVYEVVTVIKSKKWIEEFDARNTRYRSHNKVLDTWLRRGRNCNRFAVTTKPAESHRTVISLIVPSELDCSCPFGIDSATGVLQRVRLDYD
jgi:hypothetical protein